MASNNGNFGSKKPLNWKKPITEEKTVVKSTSWKDTIAAYSRHGTPPTRRGAFNGVMPVWSPAVPDHLNPALYLDKAIRRPVKYGPGGRQFERKRDAQGQFTTQQDTGQESTAEEDQTDQQRIARLRHAKQKDALTATKERARKALNNVLPGEGDNTNDEDDNIIGMTSTGKNIHDNPNNSEHEEFNADDHQEAADQERQMAGEVEDDLSKLTFQNNADNHDEQALDSLSPGDRFMDNAVNDATKPGSLDELARLLSQPDGPDLPVSNPGGMDPMAGQMQPPPEAMSPVPGQPPTMPMDLDPMANFTNPNSVDQNKPLGSPPSPGPAPGMIDTRTGLPVGPQTPSGRPADDNPLNILDAQMSPQPPMGVEPTMPQMNEDPLSIMDPMTQQPDPMAMDEGSMDVDEMLGYTNQPEMDYAEADFMQTPDGMPPMMSPDMPLEQQNQPPTPSMPPQPPAEAPGLMPDKNNIEVPDTNAGAPGPMAQQNRDDEFEVEESEKTAIKAIQQYLMRTNG